MYYLQIKKNFQDSLPNTDWMTWIDGHEPNKTSKKKLKAILEEFKQNTIRLNLDSLYKCRYIRNVKGKIIVIE